MRKINPKRLTCMCRKLKALRKKLDAGAVEYDDIDNMYRSWVGGYKKYMSKL